MRHRLPIFLALITALSATLACGSDAGDSPLPVATLPTEGGMLVAAARVERPRLLEAGGIVQASTTALVSSRIVADVRQVLVRPGDRVRAGQPLVRLDDRQSAAERARAVASAEAVTHMARAADAERTAADAAVALASATAARIERLHERKAATTQELDEARAALAGAKARFAAAEARVAEAAAATTAAVAAARTADVAATYTTLTAPFDGIVTETLVEAGNQAAPGMPLLRIESATRRLDVTVDASRVSNLAAGDDVDIVIGETEAAVRGTITEIARAAAALSQAVLVKIALPESAPIRSGQFARARLVVGREEVLTVPAASLRRQGQLTQVIVDEGGRRTLRLVSAGAVIGEQAVILAGLEAGEQVVVPGAAR
ncbi:MAG: efflux RND transporter periplasmic adaptor subunit [Acidobacteriota bacterium]